MTPVISSPARGLRDLKIRLLGDAVLRRVAWDLPDQLGWASTYTAEYLAAPGTRLQGDAFVTLDRRLARIAKGARLLSHPSDALR